jgi:hypothetical protein
LAGELAIVRSKATAWMILLRAMGDHIPMVEVQKTLKEAAVIGNELESTTHGLPNEMQGPKVAADGFRQNDLIRAHLF